jgi:hypothetical protein
MPKKTDQLKAIWNELNPRQRQYLRTIYANDQSNEASEKAFRANGQWDRPGAAVWRWLLYATLEYSHTQLKADLRRVGVDSGTGSTFEALERRGLIECKYTDQDTSYEGRLAPNSPRWYVFIKITKQGRAVVRANDPGYKPAKRWPVGILRLRQWQAIEALYHAGEEGLDYNGYSRQFVWLRLKDYKQRGVEYPLVREGEQRAVITPEGRAYYEAFKDHYRTLYPELYAQAKQDNDK